MNEEIPSAEETVAEVEPSSCDPAYLAQTNPFTSNDVQAIAAGEPIYTQECAECHGEDGTGAISLVRDFTNPVVRGSLLESPGEYLCRVAEGINRMPSFKDALSESEMWQVLTFIASLGE